MTNRRLTISELEKANELLDHIRSCVDHLSAGDTELRFALNRKVAKELTYDEREKPAVRRKLKMVMRKLQDGLCAQCKEPLPARYTVLDRIQASLGYTPENTQVICETCDRRIQNERSFA